MPAAGISLTPPDRASGPRASAPRIAIIGAGPSGLYAAEALRRRGYRDLTIYERQARVGGLALSRIFETADGRRIPYDMGSVQPFGSINLFRLIRELGLHLGRDLGDGRPAHAPQRFLVYNTRTRETIADYFRHPLTGHPWNQTLPRLRDVFRLLPWLVRFRKLMQPGHHHGLDRQWLEMSEAQWLEARNFESIAPLLRGIFSISAHGGIHNDPQDPRSLVQSLKTLMFTLRPPWRYNNGLWLPIREGYQEVLNRLSQRFNVVLQADITAIERDDNSVRIACNGQESVFDALIVACPPARLASVMALGDEESALASGIRNRPTWRVAFLARGIPEPRAVYVFNDQAEYPDAPASLGDFHCNALIEGQGRDALRFYDGVIGLNRMEGIEEALRHSERRLADVLGAYDIRWTDQLFWPNFNSHFGLEHVAAGAYERFERLQGRNRTWYTGEYLAGNSHSMVLEYSWNLIDKHFKRLPLT